MGRAAAPPVTNGGGLRPLLRPFAVMAAFVALVDVVNVLSALHDAARRGESLGAWEPITWEATSGVAELIALPIIVAALRVAPPDRARWGRVLAVHVLASLAFSAVHVALMMALRIAVYGTLGFRYHVEAGAAPYEYRKDLLAYLVLAGVLYLFTPRAPVRAGARRRAAARVRPGNLRDRPGRAHPARPHR